MKNKFIISEEEKSRIINLYVINPKKGNTISEALGGGQDQSSIDRMKAKYPNGFNIPTQITSSGTNTFANGVDTINKNDPKIKEILLTISDLLKTTKGKVNVVVSGGASKVGSSSGYDNQALAQRRRDNLINLIKGNWNTTRLIVTPGDAKVGKATVKDSPEAQKEQYVSASIYGQGEMNIPIKGVEGDNTNVYIPNLINKNIKKNQIPNPTPNPIPSNKRKKICITIPISAYKSFNRYFKKFAEENGLSNIPWSEKDV